MQSSEPLLGHTRLAWLAVLPLLLYLLLTGAGASNGAYLTPFRVLSLAVLVLVFAGWAAAAWRYPAARPRTAMAVPIVAALVAMCFSTLASPRPRLGIEFVGYAAVLAGLYVLLVRLLSIESVARRIALVLAVVTIVVGGAYVLAVLGLWVEWWGLVGRIAVPPTRPAYEALMYGAPGILAAFLACAGATSVAMLWPVGGASRAFACIAATLAAVAVFLLAARSGWAAFAAAAMITAAVGVLFGGRVSLPASRARRGALGAVSIGAFVLALAVAPAVLRRLSTGGGEDLRTTLSAVAVRLWEAHQVVGAGPGTWVSYRAQLTAAYETDYYIPHAHNAPLQLLAETGIVGVVVALVVAAWVARLASGRATER